MEGIASESPKSPRAFRWTNKKEPLLPLMDRRGGTLDYKAVLHEGEVPSTFILRNGLQEVAGPKQIDCRLNASKKTKAMEPYDKASRVGHDLCGRKEIDVQKFNYEGVKGKPEADFQSFLIHT